MVRLVTKGELPTDISLENTLFQDTPNMIQNLRPTATGENKTNAVRELAITTIKARRSDVQRKWDELQNKTRKHTTAGNQFRSTCDTHCYDQRA